MPHIAFSGFRISWFVSFRNTLLDPLDISSSSVLFRALHFFLELFASFLERLHQAVGRAPVKGCATVLMVRIKPMATQRMRKVTLRENSSGLK